MKILIEEYQDIILNVISSALFYILLFVVISALYKMCIIDFSFLL